MKYSTLQVAVFLSLFFIPMATASFSNRRYLAKNSAAASYFGGYFLAHFMMFYTLLFISMIAIAWGAIVPNKAALAFLVIITALCAVTGILTHYRKTLGLIMTAIAFAIVAIGTALTQNQTGVLVSGGMAIFSLHYFFDYRQRQKTKREEQALLATACEPSMGPENP